MRGALRKDGKTLILFRIYIYLCRFFRVGGEKTMKFWTILLSNRAEVPSYSPHYTAELFIRHPSVI